MAEMGGLFPPFLDGKPHRENRRQAKFGEVENTELL